MIAKRACGTTACGGKFRRTQLLRERLHISRQIKHFADILNRTGVTTEGEPIVIPIDFDTGTRRKLTFEDFGGKRVLQFLLDLGFLT